MVEPGVKTDSAPMSDQAVLRIVSAVPRAWKIKRLLWSMVQAIFYRLSFHTWSGWRCFLLRFFGAKVGVHCTIRRTSRVYYPWLLEIGDLSSFGDYAEIYNLAQVTIGSRVTISQEAYLCAGTHDYTRLSMPLVTAPINVGDDAWICARAFVGPGLNVGDGAVVSAGAVVMKNVPAWTIVVGNPAVPVKERVLEEHES
ncbi:MAG TPA: WcaF family extracellular polysaccharide biosynthesis acetyltransferase [Phycisphaerae bacterium]|nr:WcaF family extracellular polysaccharide biosynthesis acetyltransferase [Phycisphaerae bacterium]